MRGRTLSHFSASPSSSSSSSAWKYRAAALILASLGTLVNFIVASYLLSFWRVLKWESDSEWESSAQEWRIDSIKVVWALCSAYFVTATVACVVGVVGVVKRNPSFIRLFRDYSVADLCFCGLFTVFTALASFRPGIRATVCEELSRQPELLRDLAEAGLNLENCELWFEHAVVGVVAVTAILLVVRVQFILTVSNYYVHLLRQRMYDTMELGGSDVVSEHHQRIFLLPAPRGLSSSVAGTNNIGGVKTKPKTPAVSDASGEDDVAATIGGANKGTKGNGGGGGGNKKKGAVLVYAPVSIDSLSEEEARELVASEAWVTTSRPRSGHGHSLSHAHAHSHSLSSSRTRRHSYSQSQMQMHGRRSSSGSRRHGHGHGHGHSSSHGGRISLPIHPDEGLLPLYSDAEGALVKS